MKRILFVCTGNTCRSPIAQALLKEARPDFEVKSAGVNVIPGMSASEGAIQVLREKGIELDHTSSQVNEKLVSWADVILTLTEGHKKQLNKQFSNYFEKIFTLKEYVFDEEVNHPRQVQPSFDISDPFGGTLEDYKKTANEIETAIIHLLKKY